MAKKTCTAARKLVEEQGHGLMLIYRDATGEPCTRSQLAWGVDASDRPVPGVAVKDIIFGVRNVPLRELPGSFPRDVSGASSGPRAAQPT